jgi:hypothetical protein
VEELQRLVAVVEVLHKLGKQVQARLVAKAAIQPLAAFLPLETRWQVVVLMVETLTAMQVVPNTAEEEAAVGVAKGAVLYLGQAEVAEVLTLGLVHQTQEVHGVIILQVTAVRKVLQAKHLQQQGLLESHAITDVVMAEAEAVVQQEAMLEPPQAQVVRQGVEVVEAVPLQAAQAPQAH